jgi:hypothetical protein
MFHHDPGHDDAKISAMLEGARAVAAAAGGNLQVEAAREGLEVVLEPVPQPAGAEPAALVAEP